MAMGVNKCILVGTLGQDPEVKFLQSGQAVCSFSLATNESWKDKDGQRQDKATWHRIVAWGKLAELCGQFLQKGRQCYIEGKIDVRKYTDKQGVEKTSTEIVAREVQFLGSKTDTVAPSQPRAPQDDLGYSSTGADEDLPF